MSSYRDLIPYGPFRARVQAPIATQNEKGATHSHSSSSTESNIIEKKLALVEFKIELLVLENDKEEKLKYYREKFNETKKVLLETFKLVDFVKLVENEERLDELQQLKVSIIDN